MDRGGDVILGYVEPQGGLIRNISADSVWDDGTSWNASNLGDHEMSARTPRDCEDQTGR